MSTDQFEAVDSYLDGLFGGSDPALDAALQRSDEEGLPAIAVSSNHGRFLQVMVQASRARSVLEIGTLGGYSTIWMARALPDDGRLITLEIDPKNARIARENIDAAGVGDRVEIRLAPALESLAALEDESAGPFDLVFIDADKDTYPHYLAAAIRLSAPGTVIVTDNVVRQGAVLDASSDDGRVIGIRRFNELLAGHPAMSATAVLQVVGSKGHDGIGFGVVKDPTATR